MESHRKFHLAHSCAHPPSLPLATTAISVAYLEHVRAEVGQTAILQMPNFEGKCCCLPLGFCSAMESWWKCWDFFIKTVEVASLWNIPNTPFSSGYACSVTQKPIEIVGNFPSFVHSFSGPVSLLNVCCLHKVASYFETVVSVTSKKLKQNKNQFQKQEALKIQNVHNCL